MAHRQDEEQRGSDARDPRRDPRQVRLLGAEDLVQEVCLHRVPFFVHGSTLVAAHQAAAFAAPHRSKCGLRAVGGRGRNRFTNRRDLVHCAQQLEI